MTGKMDEVGCAEWHAALRRDEAKWNEKVSGTNGTHLPNDKRMKLDDDKVITLLIHNILTTPFALYEMVDWLEHLDREKIGLRPSETEWIQDGRIGKGLSTFYRSR